MMLQTALAAAMQTLAPSHLDIINESMNHGGYVTGKESHFKLTIVSKAFVGMRLVQRHQAIYALAADLLAPHKIHALAIHAYTPTEWDGVVVPDSPLCAHQP